MLSSGMTIPEILSTYKTIAVVGLSANKFRPSYGVSAYMQRAGYRIIPVNPGQSSILGETCYPDLLAVPEKVEIVNIFRQPDAVPAVVDQAIAIGAKVIWMQEDVVHEEAAAKARAAGLDVVMDRCILKDHRAAGL